MQAVEEVLQRHPDAEKPVLGQSLKLNGFNEGLLNAGLRDQISSGSEASMHTLRALNGDLEYIQAWHLLRFGGHLKIPLSPEAVQFFITDHRGKMDPELDRQLIAGGWKQKPGPHAVNTISRRLASISRIHRKCAENPCSHPLVKKTWSQIRKKAREDGDWVQRKKALTKEILDRLVSTCDESLIGIRDRSLLLVGFASGGRRRSELVKMLADHLRKVRYGYEIHLPGSNSETTVVKRNVPILGEAGQSLEGWLQITAITKGPLFRSISRHGRIGTGFLPANTVSRVVKKRALLAGYSKSEVKSFGAHSLRAGFITECGRRGISRKDAMALSGHKTHRMFYHYYPPGTPVSNPAAKLT